MAVDLPESPNNREESYLASMAGQNVEVPECPWSRKEAYLNAIDGRIADLQDEIEELENNPDVADIVDTYADLEAYDTSTLTDKDIIRVLNDETHDGNSTYYRYSKATNSFTYIGSSKTYDVFTGTDGTTAGAKGLVPAPATTDAGKFLKADGTWDDAGSSVNVVQTTGTSTTDVMSQNAVTGMIYADPSTIRKVKLGYGASATGRCSVGIGRWSVASGSSAVAIGGNDSNKAEDGCKATAEGAIAIGVHANASGRGSVALGASSSATTQGEINIGTAITAFGYNSSNYRLLTGLYDGQNAHDAATVGQTVGTTETLTIATTDWTALAGSDPYDYQATVALTTTIPANGTVELINDQIVLFGTYGFGIGSVDTTNNTITIYSIGQPSSATLTVKVKD